MGSRDDRYEMRGFCAPVLSVFVKQHGGFIYERIPILVRTCRVRRETRIGRAQKLTRLCLVRTNGGCRTILELPLV